MRSHRLSTSINIQPTTKDNLFDYIRSSAEFAKRKGFDALDFAFCIPNITDEGWERYVECALSASDEFGIKYEVCHLPFSGKIALDPSLIPEFNIKVHNGIDAAAMLGAKYAVVHPNTTTLKRKQYSEKDEFESVVNHIAPFVEHAERVGVNIVVENMRPVPQIYPYHRFCQEPDELCSVVDKLGVGVCWDFGHANLAGFRQSEALAYLGSRVKLLHVNDNKGIDDDHLPPLYGNIDWKDAMHGLALAGYDGLFNYELHVNTIPFSLRDKFAEMAVGIAEELMTYIV